MRGKESFAAADRLHQSAEYRYLQRYGRRVESVHFVLYCGILEYPRPRGDAQTREGSRLGITVSRRVGSAVVRNQVKRHVRELFRRYLRAMLPTGTSLVVIARPGAGVLSSAAVAYELKMAAAILTQRAHR